MCKINMCLKYSKIGERKKLVFKKIIFLLENVSEGNSFRYCIIIGYFVHYRYLSEEFLNY